MTPSERSINRAAVIGAGTMGAGIAAQLASVGVEVDLLDVPADTLTHDEVERGLTLVTPAVRNRIAEMGWARARASRPASELSRQAAERVSVGNLEDDLARLGQAHWIIEAVFEDLTVKREVMATIEAARSAASLVSTNTSGIPVRAIVDGRSEEFSRHFMGTHFFNPPLTMKIVELIPGPKTDGDLLRFMRSYIEGHLQKSVVVCKDTPNFIANRVASVQASYDMNYVLTHGYTVEETDAILGPIVGRPSTAVFRLRDLVGMDVSTRVAENLYPAIAGDAFRQALMQPRLIALRAAMLERGLLGRKSGGGFYHEIDTPQGRRFLALDLNTLEYAEPRSVELPGLTHAHEIADLGDRLRFVVSRRDRVGGLAWASLSHVMAYAAYCLPDIADEVQSVDTALRLGYSWKMGPFEIWDALGLPETLARMRQDGLIVAAWVDEMVRAGHTLFYKLIDDTPCAFSPIAMEYLPLERIG